VRRGRLLLSALIALTAPVLLAQGLAGAQIVPGPVAWNGFWQANLSLGYLQLEQADGQLKMSVRDGGAAAASKAFGQEPLASDALFVLAADYRTKGELEKMQQVLNLGASLDKRNRNLGALQLEQAAMAGDIPETLAILDRLAITNPKLTSEFVRPLTAALDDASALPLLQTTIEQGPVWREAFWGSIPASATGVANMYALRRLTDAGTTPDTDAKLLAGLAGAGLYAEALAFWDENYGGEANPTAFLATGDFAPIGWKMVSSGERAFASSGPGQFDIYILDQTFGELARQLVRLERGSYRLSARITPIDDAKAIEATLRCATSEADGFEPETLEKPIEWAVDGSCSTYWLVLSGSAWDRRTPLNSTMSQIQFARVN